MKENVVVFFINECDFIATIYPAKNTKEWYSKEFGEEVISCRMMDLRTDGVWCEICEDEAYGSIYSRENKIGNVKLLYGCLCQYKSLKELIREYEEIRDPFVIASIEY